MSQSDNIVFIYNEENEDFIIDDTSKDLNISQAEKYSNQVT